MDLNELVSALKAGESWAGSALVTVLGPALMGYADRNATGLSQADRELAVERAIETGVRKIEKYDPDRAGLGSWLRPFVRHALAGLRRERGHAQTEQDAELENLSAPDDPPTSESEAAAALGWLVRELSIPDQIMIRLRDYDGCTYDEIAELVGGVTPAACRVRHYRAVRRLALLAQARSEFAPLIEGGPK